MAKKWLILVLITVLSLSMFVGCVKKRISMKNDKKEVSNIIDKEEIDPAIEIVFWHAMTGQRGESVKKMVDDFNKSQDKIKVSTVFQGNYDDAINKMKSAMKRQGSPDIIQIYDIGTRFMIDSGHIIPIQDFIDADNYDLSDLEPNLLGYYSIDDKLYSMPFNSSTPLLYYNKDAFTQVGLNSETPPKNLDEIKEYAKKLTIVDDGKITRYGYTMATYGWFFEQFISKQNAHYVDNGNGREAKAQKVIFDNNESGLKIFKQWKELMDKEHLTKYGKVTTDAQGAFINGSTAMIIDSASSLSSILSGVDGRFEVGTAYFPDIDKDTKGGVSIGGGSLWIPNTGDDAKQEASWEFIKFMVSPEQQAYWARTTGYFAITRSAYDNKEMKEYLEKYPQFQTAINQLRDSPLEARGALFGVFPEARKIIETNIEKMIQEDTTPQQAIKNAATDINIAIDSYE